MTAAMSYFVILVTRRDWDTVKEALTFAAPPTAMVFFLFRRSAQLVGTPLGGNNYPPQPVKQSAMLFISNGMKLFGIDRHRALNSDYAIPYIVAMAVFVVILMSRFLADSDRRAQVQVTASRRPSGPTTGNALSVRLCRNPVCGACTKGGGSFRPAITSVRSLLGYLDRPAGVSRLVAAAIQMGSTNRNECLANAISGRSTQCVATSPG